VRVDDDIVVDGGPLAFLGVLPTLNEIRDQVKAHGVEGTKGETRAVDKAKPRFSR
jgi:hypothetical protein